MPSPSVSRMTPKRQAWLQTGPPTYSPPQKEGSSSSKKRAKSCDDDSASDDEYTLTGYGDVSPEDPYVPLGSKRYNLRPRVRRPPLPGQTASPTKVYESSYARVLAEHLRQSRREESSPSPSQAFKAFMESMRSSRRKAWKRADSSSSRAGSSPSRVHSSSPGTSPLAKTSACSDVPECVPPIPSSRVRRRPPIPAWE